MDYRQLPVYQQKDKILAAIRENQVIVVESPTGSGKTTQIPVILEEAGFGRDGVIGVTQPRRIAAISVSEFIARQLDAPMPGIVGYKMRFEDKTDQSTRIKIMTDGILLQEMKLDPAMSRYSVIMVDEAHERSLNIDFILGLLKRVLKMRPEFKVIVSSATINASIFSEYFGSCPIVRIDTSPFPVTTIWDPPALEGNTDALLAKIAEIVNRLVKEEREGDVLIFLPGERAIKDCMSILAGSEAGRRISLIPLYSRLGKDEQGRVFEDAPAGKTKVVVSTNIAETSVTINGITSVIDSGQAKLNFYNPRTYTASLVEVPISQASANQRKGRAGRTAPGYCYRLYKREDFDNRSLFTLEEIYRTDLSEVLLRMAELGIKDFEDFDFISRPPRSGIIGAMEILKLLDALEEDRSLSKIGQMMCEFPLLPRLSRMIVEAIIKYPKVLDEVIIAASFLSTSSPYVLPPGEEMEARAAHHRFRDPLGDFVSWLRIYEAFKSTKNRAGYAEKNYLDERTMHEILRIKEQIELIVSDMGVPIEKGGSREDYLCAVSRGLIQFVCARIERGQFRTLMAERVQIHPGSVMFRENPEFIVAGEIVRTTRMYAMSVSPLQRKLLERISPLVSRTLLAKNERPLDYAKMEKAERQQKKKAGQERPGSEKADSAQRDYTNRVKIGAYSFPIIAVKKKKKAVLDWENFSKARTGFTSDTALGYGSMTGVIKLGHRILMDGEKLETIIKIANWLQPEEDLKADWPRHKEYSVHEDLPSLVAAMRHVLQLAYWKSKKQELGFVALFNDGEGIYRFRISRGFHTALHESIASLETLSDELAELGSTEQKELVGSVYRKLSGFFD